MKVDNIKKKELRVGYDNSEYITKTKRPLFTLFGWTVSRVSYERKYNHHPNEGERYEERNEWVFGIGAIIVFVGLLWITSVMGLW